MTSGEKIILFITYTMGVVFLTLGYYFYSSTHTFLENSISVDGIVIGLQDKEGTSRPIVEFVDHKGILRTYKSSTGTNPPIYFIGENVKILYDPNDPKYPVNSRIESTLDIWGIPIFFTALGFFFILVSTLVWYVIKYHGGVWFFRKEDRLEFERTGKIE